MNLALLKNNWALVIAGILLMIVCSYMICIGWRQSATGKLQTVRRELRIAKKHHATQVLLAQRLKKKTDNLEARCESIRPSVLEETRGRLQDAEALQKIAHDKLLVAQNHVRRVIHAEFAPAKHERLREKYLPEEATDRKPFSF